VRRILTRFWRAVNLLLQLKIIINRAFMRLLLLLVPVLLPACNHGDDTTIPSVVDTGGAPDSGTQTQDLPGYAYASRFDGADSVSTAGQAFRQLLIDDLSRHMGGLTNRLNTGFFPMAGEVEAELSFFLDFDSVTSGAVAVAVQTDPAPLQGTYDEVSSDKDLVGKLAGNDPVGQHQDWSTALAGFADAPTPEALVRGWFAQIDAAALATAAGDPALAPDDAPVPAVYVTASGVDLQQLTEKFLRGAIAFSQGTDDYLDDDEPGKGLRADHSKADGDHNYTALEHAWDEGFGYFGAPRRAGEWTDAILADPGTNDDDGDGAIDLIREVAWGHAGNAAKRDLGAVAATDFTADAWEGFTAGRALIAGADGPLSADDMQTLQQHRDRAVGAWEDAIAATVVHYINAVLGDMAAIGTADYDFGAHAKHWSEGKGFALAPQFNPRSPLSSTDFNTLHALLGEAPVLPDAPLSEREQYADGLRTARQILADVYGFDPANLGGDDGSGGW